MGVIAGLEEDDDEDDLVEDEVGVDVALLIDRVLMDGLGFDAWLLPPSGVFPPPGVLPPPPFLGGIFGGAILGGDPPPKKAIYTGKSYLGSGPGIGISTYSIRSRQRQSQVGSRMIHRDLGYS